MKKRTIIGLAAAALALGIGAYAFTASSEEGHGFGPSFTHHRGMGPMAGDEPRHDARPHASWADDAWPNLRERAVALSQVTAEVC
jgi:hypothetical protein